MTQRKEKIWKLLYEGVADAAAIEAIAAENELSPIAAKLLYCRGYRTAEAVKRFLTFEDTLLHSPFLLRDMDRAVARIRRALAEGEKIVIYGDYDVDGVTSVSLLYLYLCGLGADVSYYIPSRSGEGYGLSPAAIGKLREEGVSCIITVDTGITANAETEYAKTLGVDMVITDHHECRLPLPDAAAVVNPHRPDCTYPFADLAGVGVAFKLVSAIEATIGMEQGEKEIDGIRRICMRFADLVAIGTVADVMPITDENRLIVSLGLSIISKNCRLGLSALIEEANRPAGGKPAKRKKITSSFIGFGIAPRLNAAGRMSEATRAVELLLADTPEEATRLAAELCEINRQRQTEENRIAEQVYRRIDEEFDLDKTGILVLEDDSWRQGIIGIVASRVTERYGLPSILISFDGSVTGFDSPDDLGKGSGRSIKGMNLVEALTDAEDLLVKFGGHELAAGLTVTRANVEPFRQRINAYARERLCGRDVRVQLDADMELPLSAVSLELAMELCRFEPYGVANPVPRFIFRDLLIERVSELGGGKHLKLTVSKGDVSLPALCFSTTLSRFGMKEGDRVDLMCTIDVNEFQNMKSVQLVVQDYRPCASFAADCAAWEETYRKIRQGAPFDKACYIPERQDFVRVYTLLRREFRAGQDTFLFSALLNLVNLGEERQIHYVALRYILEIFHELRICGVEEEDGLLFRFDIFFNASKTNIEKSSILKKLKSQYCHKAQGVSE